MSYHRGPPLKLLPAQIRRVLRWHARSVAFRAKHGTARDVADLLQVNVYVVRRALWDDGTSGPPGAAGRKPLLSPAKRRFVRRWAAAGRRFRATQLTAQELADDLGVSRPTIYDCIRRRGRYTAVDQTPLHTPSVRGGSRSTRHAPTQAAAERRAALLQAWPRALSPPQPRRITGPPATPARNPSRSRS